MIIDTHQHYWKYNPREYGWIGEEMASLRRDFLPEDLQPLLKPMSVRGTVAVQARQCLEETEWLLQLADEHPWIFGVIGWVDLCRPDAEKHLERFKQNPKFKGVRHVVQDEPDDQFILREDFQRGLARLKDFGLTYDLLVLPKHLPYTIDLVRRFPDQPFVLDHIAKPSIKDGVLSPWTEQIRELAKSENVYCKISGLVTEADWASWKASDFDPYLDTLFHSFGSYRVMIGSDWPVCTLAGSYEDVMGIPLNFIESFTAEEKEEIYIENAKRFYRLDTY